MSARAWYLHYVYCQLWKLGRHHPECWTIQLIDLIRSRFIHISRWPPGISVRDPGSKYFSSILLLKLLHCGFGKGAKESRLLPGRARAHLSHLRVSTLIEELLQQFHLCRVVFEAAAHVREHDRSA